MHSFRLASDPTQGALPDPYLGQSIGPMPGYGVSRSCILILEKALIAKTDSFLLPSRPNAIRS